jgi:hypothetical protein
VALSAPPAARPDQWIPVTIHVLRDGHPVAHARVRVTAFGDPPQVLHRYVTTNAQGIAHDQVRGPVPGAIQVVASLGSQTAQATVHLQAAHPFSWWWLLLLLLLLLLTTAFEWHRRNRRARQRAVLDSSTSEGV